MDPAFDVSGAGPGTGAGQAEPISLKLRQSISAQLARREVAVALGRQARVAMAVDALGRGRVGTGHHHELWR